LTHTVCSLTIRFAGANVQSSHTDHILLVLHRSAAGRICPSSCHIQRKHAACFLLHFIRNTKPAIYTHLLELGSTEVTLIPNVGRIFGSTQAPHCDVLLLNWTSLQFFCLYYHLYTNQLSLTVCVT